VPAADESGGKDAATVHDEQVAGAQQGRQVPEDVMARGARGPIQYQQAGGVALGGGLLRNSVGRQVVVEVGGLQNSFFCGVVGGGTRPKCW
jgi:hypothetical protein